jgi:hypothetical protein
MVELEDFVVGIFIKGIEPQLSSLQSTELGVLPLHQTPM